MKFLQRLFTVCLLALASVGVYATNVTINIHNYLSESITFEKISVSPGLPESGTIAPGATETMSAPVSVPPGFVAQFYVYSNLKSRIGTIDIVTLTPNPSCNDFHHQFYKANGDLFDHINTAISCQKTGSQDVTFDLTLGYTNPPKVGLQIKNVTNANSDNETLSLLSADPAVASDYYLSGQKPQATIQPGDTGYAVFTPAPNSTNIRPYGDDAILKYGYVSNDGTSACVVKFHVIPMSTADKKPVCSITTTASNENPNRHLTCGWQVLGYNLTTNQCDAEVYIEFGKEAEQTTHVTMSNTTEGIPAGQNSSISLSDYSPQPGQSTENFYRNPDQGPVAKPTLDANSQSTYDYIQKNLTEANMTYAYTADKRLACHYTYGREGDQCAAAATPSDYIGTVRSLVCSASAVPQADGSCKAEFGMTFGDYRKRDIVANVANTVTDELNQSVALTRTEITPSSNEYPTPPPTEIKAGKTATFDYKLTDKPMLGSVTYTYQQGSNASSCKVSYNWTFSPFTQDLGCSVSTQVINQGNPGVRLACNATPVTLDGQVCRANVSITTGEKLPPVNYQVSVKNISGLAAQLQAATPPVDSEEYSSPPLMSISQNNQIMFTLHEPMSSPTPAHPASVSYGYAGINQYCQFDYSWDPTKLCDLAVKWVKKDDHATQAPLASGLYCSPCNKEVKYDPNTRTCYIGFAISLNRNCEL